MNRFSRSRRTFLKQASGAVVAGSTGMMIGSRPLAALAQTKSAPDSASARVLIDSRRTIAPLDRNLFGSFLEHLGRAIYGGIYDPGSKLSELQLARRRRTAAEPSPRARQGLELDRIQSVRDQ